MNITELSPEIKIPLEDALDEAESKIEVQQEVHVLEEKSLRDHAKDIVDALLSDLTFPERWSAAGYRTEDLFEYVFDRLKRFISRGRRK